MPKRKKSGIHHRLNLSHHKHTGKRLPWRETSLGLLIIALLFTGFVLGYANSARAQTENSLNNSVTLSGVVPSTPENSQPAATESAPTPEPASEQIKGLHLNFISGSFFMKFLWTLLSAFFGILTFVWIASKSAFLKVVLWKTIHP